MHRVPSGPGSPRFIAGMVLCAVVAIVLALLGAWALTTITGHVS